jgi:hypothetical protein
MSDIPASPKLSELSGLLTQLQDLNNSDLRLLPETPEQRQYREERAAWDRVKNLISNILKDPELQRQHTQLQSVLTKCQLALTKLRLYGSIGFQDQAQAIVQNEAVFNQLVDNIKLFYTLEDKQYMQSTHGYSPKIMAALESIVNKIIFIGRDMHFIKQLELKTEPHWKDKMIEAIQWLTAHLQRNAHAQSLQKLSVLSQKLDTQFTQYIARPTASSIYNSMVAEIQSFYTAENVSPLPWGTTRTLHIIVICLLGYGRKYGFKLNKIEALDAWYWRCCNPHGYGTT